ncbi:hypothetical protein K438DRAFT_1878629 [Mycena galopus ATCC 62051]|nr:hypothetical protein K438DRAFT_1878629 [Mycena galopus ATCC 62051]
MWTRTAPLHPCVYCCHSQPQPSLHRTRLPHCSCHSVLHPPQIPHHPDTPAGSVD